MSWTSECEKVVFSDEKKLNLSGPDGFYSYYQDLRREPRWYCKGQCGGAPIMVCGAISRDETFRIVFVEAIMRSEDYKLLLENHLRPQTLEKVGNDFVFKQDCAYFHTAETVENWFRAKK